MDLVIKERGYEFIFEGKRWFDLKRTGTADEILLANRGITIADSHYLWPIPVGEISFNDAIIDHRFIFVIMGISKMKKN